MTEYEGYATNVWYLPLEKFINALEWLRGNYSFYELIESEIDDGEIYQTEEEIVKKIQQEGYYKVETNGYNDIYLQKIGETSEGDKYYGKIMIIIEKRVPTDKDLYMSLNKEE